MPVGSNSPQHSDEDRYPSCGFKCWLSEGLPCSTGMGTRGCLAAPSAGSTKPGWQVRLLHTTYSDSRALGAADSTTALAALPGWQRGNTPRHCSGRRETLFCIDEPSNSKQGSLLPEQPALHVLFVASLSEQPVLLLSRLGRGPGHRVGRAGVEPANRAS